MATFSWQNYKPTFNIPTGESSPINERDAFLTEYINLLAQSQANPNNYEILMALAEKMDEGRKTYGLTDNDFASIVASPEFNIQTQLQGAQVAENAMQTDAELRKKQFDLEKATVGAGIANEGLNAIIGAAQMFSAHKALKNLTKPKYPTPNVNTGMLTERIGQAQRLASGINPILERAQVADLAESAQRSKELAKGASGGSSGTYAALMTAAHANRLKAQRANELMNQQVAQSYQEDLDRLIALKMANDWKNFEALKGRFNDYDYPEYKTARQAATNKSAQGLQNISGALSSVPQWTNMASTRAYDWAANAEALKNYKQ